MSSEDLVDIVVVGAGPTGLAVGLEAVARNLSHVIVEKGTVVNTIVGYPVGMTFFSTPELLELGAVPFTTPHVRPTREEAIQYYRGVARAGALRFSLGNRVLSVDRLESAFVVHTEHGPIYGRRVVIATGYFDHPNPFDVAGSDLPKVHRYYREPYKHFDQDVVVVGGRNSAVEAALDLWRHGARVTVVHRGADFGRSVKYWIRPDIDNRVRRGEIAARFTSEVVSIDVESVSIRDVGADTVTRLSNDAVYALIGYRPDVDLLTACGIAYDADTLIPTHSASTFETNVPGVYIAGSVGCGCRTWEIFIENGRHHASVVVADIARSLKSG